jgi:hypothetical protein
VNRLEEVRGLQKIGNPVETFVVDEDRAKKSCSTSLLRGAARYDCAGSSIRFRAIDSMGGMFDGGMAVLICDF